MTNEIVTQGSLINQIVRKERKKRGICEVAECGRITVTKRFCDKHYRRFRLHGSPDERPKRQRATCTIDGCGKPAKGRGYCSKHWFRWRYNGDPLKVKAWVGDGATAIDKFWSKVALTADDDRCWLWLGSTNGKYGNWRYEKERWFTHQFSWFLANGRKPRLQILHHCDVKLCVNPKHLYEGTHQQNMDDLFWRGEHIQRIELSENDYWAIQAMFKANKTITSVATEFQFSVSTGSAIKNGTHWSCKVYGGLI